jgi:PH (Pleckstrin Homology) domain-containing protein
MAANQSSGGTPQSSTPPDATPGQPAAGSRKRARKAGDGAVQTFRSPTAVVIWVVWLLFALANWIDLAVQGRDHLSAVAAAILLLVTGIGYVTAQRPRIIADEAGVTVRNPLRDHRIGWAAVTRVDLADLLRVHTGQGQRGKVISSWAVPYSRRRKLAAESRARRASRPRRSAFGLPYGDRGLPGATDRTVAGPVSAELEAEKIARTLSERATAARAETVWATGTAETAGPKEATSPGSAAVTGWLEPLTSTWSRTAIAAVLVPALILLVVCLL